VAERDAAALARELATRVRGEVRFDAGARALYSTDASNYRQVPIGVVLPRDAEDVVAAVEVCRRHGAPLLSRGGGTSIPGQCCNVAVVLDHSKYHHGLLALDPETRSARVQPGIVLDTLRDAAERHHLTFGPDPATHTHCTLGGMIGNNSCGVHSVQAGRTADNVEALDVLLYDGTRLEVGATSEDELERIVRAGGRRGEIYARLRALRDRYADEIRARFPRIPRRVSGYNLDELLPERGFHVARALVGSESTCVTVLEARVRLVESPPARALLVAGFADVFTAADHVPEALAHGPIGLEGIDAEFLDDLRAKSLHLDKLGEFPPGGGFLLVEFGADDPSAAHARAERLAADWRGRRGVGALRVLTDRGAQRRVWEVRDSGLGATARVPGRRDNWEGWEDSAVPPDKLGAYLRSLRRLLDDHGYHTSLYGHFGGGCVHARIDFDLVTAAGIAEWKSFLQEAADLVVGYGGSLSGEHGDGQARGWLLPRMFGETLLGAFREFKAIWDPDGRMNPGKKVDADPVDAHLRLGVDYEPPVPRTNFRFPDDTASFARATLRCVGAGVCRREHGGVMCPSYRVTRDEEHSTRGRARLLFEMLQGEPLRDGWRSDAVREALDLCLACKGCKLECPVRVDMASYKAEFMSHYYAGRLRPRSAYAFGWIGLWARLAEPLGSVAHLVSRQPGAARLAAWAAGVHPARRIPPFAAQSFRRGFQRRAPTGHGPPVLLWPDTFNDCFLPETAHAAAAALERLGFRVRLPPRRRCCGRPLYDYGFLRAARRWLARILDDLREDIRAGVPIVVLEPSCAAVFRDELLNLFPHDHDAMRLARQTFLLPEFLSRHAGDRELPRLAGRALVHGHCHHRAIGSLADEEEVLRRIGLEVEVLDSGCCGMAGAFGYERAHYDVAMRCGERVLLPAVRRAEPGTLIVADGFSCREQIRQSTGREPLHLAEVVSLAARGGEDARS
jgi:FAD/FMN-containing dehydrogenase/Fe-S oxidoreductase